MTEATKRGRGGGTLLLAIAAVSLASIPPPSGPGGGLATSAHVAAFAPAGGRTGRGPGFRRAAATGRGRAPSFVLRALPSAGADAADGKSAGEEDDDDEDDEDDLITQKLRRSAGMNGLNPANDYDRMVEDNEKEANVGVAVTFAPSASGLRKEEVVLGDADRDAHPPVVGGESSADGSRGSKEEVIEEGAALEITTNVTSPGVAASAVNTNSSAAASDLTESELNALYNNILANTMDPEFDRHSTHEEAYVEKSLRSLLSRKGDELREFGPGVTTLPLDPDSDEAKAEREVSDAESALQDLVDGHASETTASLRSRAIDAYRYDAESAPVDGTGRRRDWTAESLDEAAKLQSRIDRMHVDDCGAVLLANMAFYEAFSARDADAMRSAWAGHCPSATCVHPGHAPLLGSVSVVSSFENMFERSLYGDVRDEGLLLEGRMATGVDGRTVGAAANGYVSPANVRGLSVRGTTASLVCDEEVYSLDGGSGRGGGGNRRRPTNRLLSTNVFRKTGGKWKMVHRHATWHPESEAAARASEAPPGMAVHFEGDFDVVEDSVKSGKNSGEKNASKTGRKQKAFSGDGSEAKIRPEPISIRKLDGTTSSRRSIPLSPSVPDSLDGLDVNAVLGIPSGEDDDGKEGAKKAGGDDDGLMRQVINLSDLLGGGGDGGGEEDSDNDADAKNLADILGLSDRSGQPRTTGTGTPSDPIIKRTVYQVSMGPDGKMVRKKLGAASGSGDSGSGDADEQYDGYNDEEGEDGNNEDDNGEVNVVDMRGKSMEEQQSIIAKMIDGAVEDANIKKELNTIREAIDVSAAIVSPPASKDAVRRECIATLRGLSKRGLLSPKQKRVLLTDIITASAGGGVSMVETAYELLVGGGDADGGDDESDAGLEDFTEQCRVFAGDEEDQ